MCRAPTHIDRTPVTMRFTQSVDEQGLTHIFTSNIVGNKEMMGEERVLDSTRRDLHSPMFGHLKTISEDIRQGVRGEKTNLKKR